MYTLIKISSNKCVPCKILAEDFEEVTDFFPELKIEELELSETIKESFKVEKIPLLILKEDETEISRLQNSRIDKVMEWLKLFLVKTDDF